MKFEKLSLTNLIELTEKYNVPNATITELSQLFQSGKSRMLRGETEAEAILREIEEAVRAEQERQAEEDEEDRRRQLKMQRRIERHLKKESTKEKTATRLKKLSLKTELTPQQQSHKYRAAKKKSRELETAEYAGRVRRHPDNPYAQRHTLKTQKLDTRRTKTARSPRSRV